MALAPERTTARPEPRGRGWIVVARKELGDHLRSVRLIIVVVLLGISGVGAVLAAAGGIREAAESATGVPALFLALFTVAPETQPIPPFFALIGLLGPLLGIAFGFDAVNGERAQGTLPRLVSQPIYRDDVVNGKFVAGLATIGMVLTALMVFVGAMGMIRIGVVPGFSDVVRLAAFLVVTLVYIGFWLSLASLFSVWLERAATSALATLASWLVLTIFFGLIIRLLTDLVAPVPADPTVDEQVRSVQMEQTLSRLSPATLYEEATVVLLNPQVRSLGILFPHQVDQVVANPLTLEQSLGLAWPQMLGLIALTVVAFAVAYVSFMRQEVRA